MPQLTKTQAKRSVTIYIMHLTNLHSTDHSETGLLIVCRMSPVYVHTEQSVHSEDWQALVCTFVQNLLTLRNFLSGV